MNTITDPIDRFGDKDLSWLRLVKAQPAAGKDSKDSPLRATASKSSLRKPEPAPVRE